MTDIAPQKRLPRGETRERILDVSLELFNEQGYDKTSLREIAERLGVTKAAIYYHFESKADILLELHLRLHALGREALEMLDALGDDEAIVNAWPALVDRFIDQVLAHRDLFLLHQRNQQAFRAFDGNERHEAENEDMEQRFRAFLASPRIPLEHRVRMASSIGVVMMGLMGADAGGMYGKDVSPEEVAGYVRQITRDMFPVTPGTA